MNGSQKVHTKRLSRLYWTLGILLGPPLLCISVLLIRHFIGSWHMAQVNRDLFAVAEQLGYTPDTLLRHAVSSHDFGFAFDTICDASLFYTTTLSPAEFGQRVVQVLPETSGQGWSRPEHLSDLPNLHSNQDEAVTSYLWFSDRSKVDISLTFYDVANVDALLDDKGLPVTGNIVELYKSGGSVQEWSCPTRTTEITPPPAN